jgi:predicted DsbA family dithiol-disulfide isomerase
MTQQNTGTPIRIDFVSDVSCPWCAIGLQALQQALARLDPALPVELHFQPFELNPQMPAGGQDAVEHLMQKYRISAAQVDDNRAAISARAAELGLEMRMDQRHRVYNTFDAHRLLHWADELGGRNHYSAQAPALPGLALKWSLLHAYFSQGANISDHATLLRLCEEAGLDAQRAAQILSTDEYAADVRAQLRFYASEGIRAVPSVIINHRHLIQGGQPVDVFEQALRQISAVVAVQELAA